MLLGTEWSSMTIKDLRSRHTSEGVFSSHAATSSTDCPAKAVGKLVMGEIVDVKKQSHSARDAEE
jgi:hypothetical protein